MLLAPIDTVHTLLEFDESSVHDLVGKIEGVIVSATVYDAVVATEQVLQACSSRFRCVPDPGIINQQGQTTSRIWIDVRSRPIATPTAGRSLLHHQ